MLQLTEVFFFYDFLESTYSTGAFKTEGIYITSFEKRDKISMF